MTARAATASLLIASLFARSPGAARPRAHDALDGICTRRRGPSSTGGMRDTSSASTGRSIIGTRACSSPWRPRRADPGAAAERRARGAVRLLRSPRAGRLRTALGRAKSMPDADFTDGSVPFTVSR